MQGTLVGVAEDANVMKHAGVAGTAGGFDYVLCTGGIHHLDAPHVGLRSLAEAVAPRGGLFVMVYGLHGRTGVYDMQAALRSLVPGKAVPDGELEDNAWDDEVSDFETDEEDDPFKDLFKDTPPKK